MQKELIQLSAFERFYPFKGILSVSTTKKSKTMPSQHPEFKTRLRFNPNKFSTGILKRYLFDLLDAVSVDDLLSVEAPLEYTKDPNNRTNYKVLKDLGMMSVREWKETLEKNDGNVETLYLHDDMMLQDSREYYECWKIIEDEVGGHEKQMSFFRLVSEIVSDLSSRNIVELSIDGKTIVCNNNEWEKIMKEDVTKVQQKISISTFPQPSSESGSLVGEGGMGIAKSLYVDSEVITPNVEKKQTVLPIISPVIPCESVDFDDMDDFFSKMVDPVVSVCDEEKDEENLFEEKENVEE